jgi:hypothetical protein
MPRPMKFWELISAFRERKDLLEKVLSSSKWQGDYWKWYQDFAGLCERQDRQILDAPVPIELSREIAAQYRENLFHFRPEKGILQKAISQREPDDEYTEMTALEVHDRFGGAIIEEVFEKGSARVEEWQ